MFFIDQRPIVHMKMMPNNKKRSSNAQLAEMAIFKLFFFADTTILRWSFTAVSNKFSLSGPVF